MRDFQLYDDLDAEMLPRNPMWVCVAAIICGAAGLCAAFAMDGMEMVAIVLGGIGMVIGGYSISLANHCPNDKRMMFMALAALGIMLTVLAFMFGLYGMVDTE